MDAYSKYLQNKDQSNVWRKAKQREFNSLDQILLALQNLSSLTWRNAMTLRMLGFIGKPDEASRLEVGLTDAGETLLSDSHKQQILDEQLLKLYLDSYVNPSLNISIFPTSVIYETLSKFQSLSFTEYSLFICWINNEQDKFDAFDFIEHYRSADKDRRDAFENELKYKTAELGYIDFNDNIYRLFSMFKLSSFMYSELPDERWSDVLIANSDKETYLSLIKSVSQVDITDYETSDTQFLDIVKVTPNYSDITSEMTQLDAEEQKIIKKQLVERNKLPDITSVVPRQVIADMLEVEPKLQTSEKVDSNVTKKVVKIDYAQRDERNRLVGAYGERLVIKYEYKKLVRAGRSDLAAKIEQCSILDDSLGYDVRSFGENGEEKHIEVKTVTGKPKTLRFFISKNELQKVSQDKNHCIYIVLNYNTLSPEILEIGNLSSNIALKTAILEPVNFTVTLRLDYQII